MPTIKTVEPAPAARVMKSGRAHGQTLLVGPGDIMFQIHEVEAQ